MSDEFKTIVIDTSSYRTRAGFAGDLEPRSVVENAVVGPVGPLLMEDFYWSHFERIWDDTLHKELHVDQTDHPVLLTEDPMTRKPDRQHSIHYMFETQSVSSFYICNKAVLSMLSTGRHTGIVLDVGEGRIHTVPVYEGYSIQQAINRLPLGGRKLTEYLMKLLGIGDPTAYMHKLGYTNFKFRKREYVRDIKEKLCYVAYDFDGELKDAQSYPDGVQRYYKFPDGEYITITDARFRCPELLFKPHLTGLEFDGIDQTLFKSIEKCPSDVRKDMYMNIFLSGGTTMFKGFPERLHKEINPHRPRYVTVNVFDPAFEYSPWIGGSILASHPIFELMAVTREEYYEVGPNIVCQKCIM